MTMDARYVAQIQGMEDKGRAWIAEHPGVEVQVTFKFSPEALVIASISQAVRCGLVSVNQEGAALLAAMQAGIEEQYEATVVMVRIAIERLWEGKENK